MKHCLIVLVCLLFPLSLMCKETRETGQNADDEKGGLWAKDKNDAAGGMWFDKNRNTVMFNLAGLRHFKQLQIRIYTSEAGQEFGIKRLELKRVKVKTKTLG